MKPQAICFTILFIVSVVSSVGPVSEYAHAARLAHHVQKEFVFEGDSARDIAQLLGFSPETSTTKKFSRNSDAWVCRDDERDCGPMGSSELLIEYTAGEMPKMRLAGEWLDAETGTMTKVPRYSISEAFRLDDPDRGKNPWALMTPENLYDRRNSLGADIVRDAPFLVKKLETKDKRLVQVEFLHASQGLITVRLGIDETTPEERERRMKSFEACRAEVTAKGLDGGC